MENLKFFPTVYWQIKATVNSILKQPQVSPPTLRLEYQVQRPVGFTFECYMHGRQQSFSKKMAEYRGLAKRINKKREKKKSVLYY